jgi:hypothetical protein
MKISIANRKTMKVIRKRRKGIKLTHQTLENLDEERKIDRKKMYEEEFKNIKDEYFSFLELNR